MGKSPRARDDFFRLLKSWGQKEYSEREGRSVT
jgi:hypothetical protein